MTTNERIPQVGEVFTDRAFDEDGVIYQDSDITIDAVEQKLEASLGDEYDLWEVYNERDNTWYEIAWFEGRWATLSFIYNEM